MKKERMIQYLDEELNILEVRGYQIFCLIFSMVGFGMCIVNLISNEPFMAAVTAGIGIFMLVGLILFMFQRNIRLLIGFMVVALQLLMFYFMVSGGVNGFSVLWIFLMPPICMYILTLSYGLMFSLFLWAVVAIYMWTPLHELGYAYSDTWLMRFPLVFLAEIIMCCFLQYRLHNYKQQQRELLSKAEEANRSKSEFLANMSHEIRTPMNAIMGMCELVLSEPDLSRDARECCNNIHLAGNNLLEIINDLLDFSKIESGKMELVCEEYSVASLLNDVINMAMARKGDKDIEIMVDCAPDIPARLYGDELRIRQVLINLLTNAIKFTSEGGVLLQVSARRETYGINLVVHVIDSGMGIRKENLKRIFANFSQVDTKRNRGIEGTGLGLAIAKQLVQQMGGILHVASEYGTGTDFTMVIPQRVVDATPIAQVEDKEKKKVLCYLGLGKRIRGFVADSYRQLIYNISEKLEISCEICTELPVVKKKLESEGFTHLFVSKNEYLNAREYFDGMAERIQIILVQDRIQRIVPGAGIQNMYKPFYVLSATSAMNGKSFWIERKTAVGRVRFHMPGAKLLVVDDNEVNLKVVKGLLRPYNARLVTAKSGREAISLLQDKSFHLVLMDHMMPELDGVETTRMIRGQEDAYFKEIPIIALTANAVSGAKEMFLREGFQDFVSKPIEITALERAIRRLLPPELIQLEERQGEQ